MVAAFGDAVGHLHWGWDLWWRRGGWRVADPPNSPQHLIWEDAMVALDTPPDLVFAVVRDPVARLASEHRWQRRGRRATRMGKALAFLPFGLWLRLMLAVAQRNPHCFDNHLRPQNDFVPNTAQVFRLEDGLEQVVVWLQEVTATTLSEQTMPHAISTRGQVSLLHAIDAALIGKIFVEDYQRFGYRPLLGPTARPLIDRLVRWLAPVVAFSDRRGWL